MTMSYLASPLSLGNMQGSEYLSAMSTMELPDQHPNFDSDTFVRYVCATSGCRLTSRAVLRTFVRSAGVVTKHTR